MSGGALIQTLETLLQKLGLSRPEWRAWAMYDWANSAYSTVITSAVLPPFFLSFYASGLSAARATSVYAATISISLLVSALLSPVLGAMADCQGTKKRYLGWFTAAGVLATAGLAFVGKGDWVGACWLCGLSGAAIGVALVFYEGLLPHIAAGPDLDRVSAAGYALGYVGGGLLLAFNVAWMLWPAAFHLPDTTVATRLAFFSVAVWWAVFSLPVLRRVPEPPAVRLEHDPRGGGAVPAALRRLRDTFREIRGYRDLFLFLVAFWFYNDGIGTIIKMATLYGSSLGIGLSHLVLALLVTQFVAFPCSFLFGMLADTIGAKRGLYLALSVYVAIAYLGYRMTAAWHFYALAIMVGTVQGGSQALSRSLFARMVPRNMTGEFFGFFSVSSKFATILGPAVFAAVTESTGDSRLAILSIVVFFLGGMVLLRFVDVERGERRARAVEAR